MQITIFGATGKTGRHMLEQALQAGHRVSVLARDPSRLPAASEQLCVVQGNILDAAAVEQAVAGSQAVLSVLGPSSNKPTFEISQGMGHILAAMGKHGVWRLIVSTGAGVRDPKDTPTPMHNFFGILVRVLSPNVVKDMQQVVDLVRASDTDWTIVRAPMLTDGPKTGRVWSGYVSGQMGRQLSRANLAAFMLEQLSSDTHVRAAPAVSEG